MAGIIHASAVELEHIVRRVLTARSVLSEKELEELTSRGVLSEKELSKLDQIKQDLWYVARHVDPLIERMEHGNPWTDKPSAS